MSIPDSNHPEPNLDSPRTKTQFSESSPAVRARKVVKYVAIDGGPKVFQGL